MTVFNVELRPKPGLARRFCGIRALPLRDAGFDAGILLFDMLLVRAELRGIPGFGDSSMLADTFCLRTGWRM